MLKVSEVINEYIEVTDEFGNSLEFESYERGSSAAVLGELGVQVKVGFDSSTDLEREMVKGGDGTVFIQLSVFDNDELKKLHEKLGRWLSAQRD